VSRSNKEGHGIGQKRSDSLGLRIYADSDQRVKPAGNRSTAIIYLVQETAGRGDKINMRQQWKTYVLHDFACLI